ncbi:MAG: serine hydrolase domain-containing protein [Pseudomonadota bacterium]
MRQARTIIITAIIVMAAGCATQARQARQAPPAAATLTGEQATVRELQQKALAGDATGLLFWSQSERRVAFKRMADLGSSRSIRAAGSPYPLVDRPKDLSSVRYQIDGRTYTLADFFAMPAQIGFIVVQDGNVLLERYAQGNDRDSVWISFSVTKSVTSLLIGAAINDGFIESVDEPVSYYLPRLRGTGYENVSIREVLQMASGVAWNEDYGDPESDVARAGGATGLPLVSYLGTLERAHPPGAVFNYNTGETNLAGEILRAAIGNNAATYLTHKIWQPFGMESDASWVIGGPGGGETGGCCISATLRDYARLGLFAMNEGLLPDGTRVLPEGWMTASTSPSSGYEGYGYLWWLAGARGYSARGIFGQRIQIDPGARTVIAAHGNAKAAVGTDYHRHLDGAVRAVQEYLRAIH